jgi:hypothetical protein
MRSCNEVACSWRLRGSDLVLLYGSSVGTMICAHLSNIHATFTVVSTALVCAREEGSDCMAGTSVPFRMKVTEWQRDL